MSLFDAATSLAQSWTERGAANEARELLVPLIESFKQGFESAGYREATALLHRIESEAGRG